MYYHNQTKGDLAGAELYYSRAILADPEDGDILCQYARVIWELHHDQERARSYFERAIQASSQDRYVLHPCMSLTTQLILNMN